MKRSREPRGLRSLAGMVVGAGVLLAASAGTVRADCAAEFSGTRCDIEPETSGFVVGGTSSADIFVQILGGSARHGIELFWVPSAEASVDDYVLLTPQKPPNEYDWNAGGSSYHLPIVFDGGSEVLFAVRINGGDFFYSGSLADRNPGSGDQFNLFGANGTVYLDDRTSEVANTPPGEDWMVFGVEDRSVDGSDPLVDRDYNDLVFAVRTTVTPEPLSMALLGTGLAGMAGVGRFKRRRRQDRGCALRGTMHSFCRPHRSPRAHRKRVSFVVCPGVQQRGRSHLVALSGAGRRLTPEAIPGLRGRHGSSVEGWPERSTTGSVREAPRLVGPAPRTLLATGVAIRRRDRERRCRGG